jgi:outer membrane autotransporter protein
VNVNGSTAVLDLAGVAQSVGNVGNSGSIHFNSTGSGDTFTPTVLTANGDYTGNGGTLFMSTVLGDDTSLTDQLIIEGNALGSSRIELTNAGGAGALTTNGILLVDVGGTSAANAFALTGVGVGAGTDGDGAYVDANAFRYRLFQGDVSGDDPESWYLRSQSTTKPPEPPAPPEPEYRPDVPGTTALPGILAQGNLDLLDNLHRRMGDDLNVMQNDDRLWARVFGSDSVRLRQDNVTAPEARGDHYGFQAGVDLFQNRSDNGKRNDVGLYAAYMKSHFNVSGITNTTQPTSWVSTLRPETTALGAYWTWKRDASAGFYSDLIVQYNWYGGDGQTADARFKIDGTGLLGSWEIGYGHPYSEHWSIQPQAQIVAQRNDIDDIAIPNATVDYSNKTSLAGRLGLRLVGDYTSASARQWKPYVRANYWRGFDGKQNTAFQNQAGSTLIQTQTGFDSIEVGAGFTVSMTRNVNLYAEADHVFGIGKASRELSKGIAGNVGIRVMFGHEPAPAPVVAPPPPPPPPAVAAPPPPPPPAPPPPQPTRLTLSADALFDFDSAQLHQAGRDSLATLVTGLRGMQYEVLIIEGHTDRIGTEAYNQALSERRANSVRDFLTGNGIPANNVRATGYGETRPVTTLEQCPPNQSRDALIACLQPDRRVEVEVSGTQR